MVLIVCYSLAEARGDTLQEDVDWVVVSHLGTDIESSNILQVLLDSTGLLDIPNLIKSPVQHIVVAIVHPDGLPDLSASIKHMRIGFSTC